MPMMDVPGDRHKERLLTIVSVSPDAIVFWKMLSKEYTHLKKTQTNDKQQENSPFRSIVGNMIDLRIANLTIAFLLI